MLSKNRCNFYAFRIPILLRHLYLAIFKLQGNTLSFDGSCISINTWNEYFQVLWKEKLVLCTILGLIIKIFNTKSMIIRNKQAKEQFVFIFLA